MMSQSVLLLNMCRKATQKPVLEQCSHCVADLLPRERWLQNAEFITFPTIQRNLISSSVMFPVSQELCTLLPTCKHRARTNADCILQKKPNFWWSVTYKRDVLKQQEFLFPFLHSLLKHTKGQWNIPTLLNYITFRCPRKFVHSKVTPRQLALHPWSLHVCLSTSKSQNCSDDLS